MYKHVNDLDSHLYDVIDLDTGEKIKGVQWANDNNGELERLVFNKDGSVQLHNNNIKLIKEKRNIKLVRKSKEE